MYMYIHTLLGCHTQVDLSSYQVTKFKKEEKIGTFSSNEKYRFKSRIFVPKETSVFRNISIQELHLGSGILDRMISISPYICKNGISLTFRLF